MATTTNIPTNARSMNGISTIGADLVTADSLEVNNLYCDIYSEFITPPICNAPAINSNQLTNLGTVNSLIASSSSASSVLNKLVTVATSSLADYYITFGQEQTIYFTGTNTQAVYLPSPPLTANLGAQFTILKQGGVVNIFGSDILDENNIVQTSISYNSYVRAIQLEAISTTSPQWRVMWSQSLNYENVLPTTSLTPTLSTELVPKGWVESNFVSTVDKSRLMESTIITATANGQYYWNFGDPQLMVFLTNAGPININLPNVTSASNIGATFTVKKNNQQINAIAAAGFTLLNESNQVLSTAIIGFSTVQVVSFTAISTTGSQWCVSYSQGVNITTVCTLQNGQTFVSGAKNFNTNTSFGATYSMTINAQATFNTVLPTTSLTSFTAANQFITKGYGDSAYAVAGSYVDISTAQTIGGIKTFTSAPLMSGASITAGSIPTSAVAAGFVDTSTAQTIGGSKTFSLQVLCSAGPSTNAALTRKSYVDGVCTASALSQSTATVLYPTMSSLLTNSTGTQLLQYTNSNFQFNGTTNTLTTPNISFSGTLVDPDKQSYNEVVEITQTTGTYTVAFGTADTLRVKELTANITIEFPLPSTPNPGARMRIIKGPNATVTITVSTLGSFFNEQLTPITSYVMGNTNNVVEMNVITTDVSTPTWFVSFSQANPAITANYVSTTGDQTIISGTKTWNNANAFNGVNTFSGQNNFNNTNYFNNLNYINGSIFQTTSGTINLSRAGTTNPTILNGSFSTPAVSLNTASVVTSLTNWTLTSSNAQVVIINGVVAGYNPSMTYPVAPPIITQCLGVIKPVGGPKLTSITYTITQAITLNRGNYSFSFFSYANSTALNNTFRFTVSISGLSSALSLNFQPPTTGLALNTFTFIVETTGSKTITIDFFEGGGYDANTNSYYISGITLNLLSPLIVNNLRLTEAYPGLLTTPFQVLPPYYQYYAVSANSTSTTLNIISIPNPSVSIIGLSLTFRRVVSTAGTNGIINANQNVYPFNSLTATTNLLNGNFACTITCLNITDSTYGWFITN